MVDIVLIHLVNTNRGLKSQLTKIFLLPQWEENQLGNQHVNKKHHLEAVRQEDKVKEIDC